MIKRYCEGRFVRKYISTIGIDYGVKKLTVKGRNIAINFFDLSGNDDYKGIRQEFYKDAQGVLMTYDIDNRDSYVSLPHWEEEMKKFGIEMGRVKVVLCGNKSDTKNREVTASEAQKWAKNRGYEYFETSANTGDKVNEAFETLFARVVTQYEDDRKRFGIPG